MIKVGIQNRWEEKTLGEVITLNYGKGLPQTIRELGDVPVYGSSGITGYHNQSLIQSKGLIVGRKGSIGTVYKSECPFFPIDTVYYVTEKDAKCDFKFLYYLLLNLNLHQMNSDSAVPGLNRENVYSRKILLPPLIEQTALAAVLLSFDEKIEFLQKQNQTLETLAQCLFNEWFVDFNFLNEQGKPYKKSGGKMAESTLGEIPKEWKIGRLGDITEVKGGTTPSTTNPDFWNGDICWTSPKDLSDFKGIFLHETKSKITSAGLKQIGSGLLPVGTVLLSSRAPIGYLAITIVPLAINQGYVAIVPREDYKNYFVYLWLKQNMQHIVSAANGSTFLEISKSSFRNIEILIPQIEVVKSFLKSVEPIFNKILNNEAQVQNLSTLRDSLLPQLMRGDIQVGKNNVGTLFTDDLPIAATDHDLDITKEMYPNYDGYYVTSGCIADRRSRFDFLWQIFKPYADTHFLKQYKSQFHQRSWEMYIGCVLLQNGLTIRSLDDGFDFVVDDKMYIECVACNNAEKGKPDYVPELISGCVQDVPWKQMMLRITSVIRGKFEDHYNKFSTKSWFDKTKPLILAVNSGGFPFPQDYFGIPLIIRAIFGLEFLQINQDHQSSFSWKDDVQKGDVSVPVNCFANDGFKEISGVIFSDKNVLNHPDHLGDDCVFVNNPYALNPVDTTQFSFLKRWQADKDKLTKLY